MAVATPIPAVTTAPPRRPRFRVRRRRVVLHLFLITVALVWLFPLLWAVYQSFRPYGETSAAPVALPQTLTLDNYVTAWDRAELPKYFLNTAIVVIPAVTLTLALASMIAFAVSRFSWKFNLGLLMLFTAGNLLPPQVIITPLFRMFLLIPDPFGFSSNGRLFYDQHIGIIAIHVAFQLGFCTFVLSNYMKTLPRELTEAALVDGASVLRTFWQVILPLCRPPLAALATLEFTWVYNDFFWALLLMPTGAKQPITSALNNLKGQFFTDTNMLAAGAVMVAIPTLVVYFALQRHFIKGLTLGSTKG
jgi:multiple sugar transport system permease protein